MKRLAPAAAALLVGGGLGLAPALAVGGGSGLAISPPIIAHAAVRGTVGGVTISNNTGETLRIGVSARPWLESPSGAVAPNQRSVLGNVALSATSFTLASGASRVVSLSLRSLPSNGSVYGNVDVLGVPTAPSTHGGVIVDYRLIATLRLTPARTAYGAVASGVVVTGNHKRGEIYLAVRNTGNTVTPIGGTARITSPRGSASATIPSTRLVPGVTVDLPVLALRGSLPAGSYTISDGLTAGGRVVSWASHKFALK